MAASSTTTRRPLFNFDLRRRDHVVADTALSLTQPDDYSGSAGRLMWTSGGRSGGHYYNDVIFSLKSICLPPTDPSFLAALGPVQLVEPGDDEWVGYADVVYWPIVVRCPSRYHLEPPSVDVFARLTCMADGHVARH